MKRCTCNDYFGNSHWCPEHGLYRVVDTTQTSGTYPPAPAELMTEGYWHSRYRAKFQQVFRFCQRLAERDQEITRLKAERDAAIRERDEARVELKLAWARLDRSTERALDRARRWAKRWKALAKRNAVDAACGRLRKGLDYSRVQSERDLFREAVREMALEFEKIKNGGLPDGHVGDAAYRMLVMCDIATDALQTHAAAIKKAREVK